MFTPSRNRYRVAFDGSFTLHDSPTAPPENAADKKTCKQLMASCIDDIAELQRALYAQNTHSLLLVFQAMDAAGKDSTIRAVLSGVNPAGCQVFSFKPPSEEELEHDFLWRTTCKLPERGRIGVFNRSYYEEVLVVRVHPQHLRNQRLELPEDMSGFWQERLESIADHEKHLARNGTVILKFWLNVSKTEQRLRFLSRLNEPEKHWKFSESDVRERAHWDEYMRAYQTALNATSKPWAPWYAIPADNKPFMRLQVAETIRDALQALNPQYPAIGEEAQLRFERCRQALEEV